MNWGNVWKSAFGLAGVCCFILVLGNYGFTQLLENILTLGWWSLPLALSWAPVVICYALAWQLITPEFKSRHFGILFRLSIISVAWNNLSPFVKVLGEPVRLMMLRRWMNPKSAAKSMVLYNIVHVMGTLLAFFFGAIALLIFFPLREDLRTGLLALTVISPLLAIALFYLPHWVRGRGKTAHRNKLVVAGFWLRWSFSKIRIFSNKHPARFWFSVLLEVAARFIEGLTFYVAFLALNTPVGIWESAILDVGRALLDNVFFFIPYQVGSREGGIVLLAEYAFHISPAAAVSGAVMYRLVEILWMGVGYLLWIMESKDSRSST